MVLYTLLAGVKQIQLVTIRIGIHIPYNLKLNVTIEHP
jgi:hypothetical protein